MSTPLGGLVATFLMLFTQFFACQICEHSFLHNPSQVNALFWSAVNHIPAPDLSHGYAYMYFLHVKLFCFFGCRIRMSRID